MKIPSNNNFSVKRLLIVIFVVISVLCIIFFAAISRFNTPLFHAVVINMLAPFQSVTSAVSGKISAFGDYVGDVFYVYDENRELKAQNDDLKARAARSAELESENARLRQLLNYKSNAPQFDLLPASVIGRNSSTWSNRIIINRGSDDGVRKNMTVVTPDGLVGSVHEAYGSYAEVELITDPRSAVGAIVQRADSRLAGVVRKYDLSRPVTAGLAGVVMSNETEYPSALDITGYNYTESRYVTDHQKYPERVIFGSENRHDFLAWKSVTDNDHIFGQFLWTGIDYLGESTPWPARGFGSGLLDFASYVKPLGYFRKALWSDEPFVHISTYREPCTYENSWDVWNYSPGDTVNVVCFTNCHSAELELNGEPAGERKSPDGGTGLIVWKVPYSAGVLEVNGFDGQGRHTAGHSLRTAGCPARLDVAVSEKDAAGGIYIIDVRILDKDGYQVNDAGNEIACSIDGPAVILGMESGSNTDMSLFDGSHRKAFRGRLKAYVKRTGPGSISASFSAEGMEDGIVALPDSETDIVYSR